MANTLTHDCPYCGTQRAGFTNSCVSNADCSDRYNLTFDCNHCSRAVVAYIETYGGPPKNWSCDSRYAQGNVTVLEITPRTEPIRAPEHCPESIAKAFVQAVDNSKKTENSDAAAMMARRTLEMAARDIDPCSDQIALYTRIERLARDHKITPALQEWAHRIRAFGNDAAHDFDGVTPNEARQAIEFTRYFLIYVYTLPKQIALASSQTK